MTHEEAMNRVAKLLRLAKSDNANEAALAAAQAQSIIDRYKLDTGEISVDGPTERPSEPVQNFEDPLYGEINSQNPTWKIRLASSIARANACRIWMHGGATFIVGRALDANAVRYLFSYLLRATDELAARHGKGNGRTWINNFRLGVVDTITKRLREQKAATQAAAKAEAEESTAKAFALLGEAAFSNGGQSALVRVNSAIARIEAEERETETWMDKNMDLGTRRVSHGRWDSGARAAGQKAGQSIALNSSRGGLGAGQRRIGGAR